MLKTQVVAVKFTQLLFCLETTTHEIGRYTLTKTYYYPSYPRKMQQKERKRLGESVTCPQ